MKRRWGNLGVGTDFFNKVVRIGFTMKVAVEQRIKGGERGSHVETGWKEHAGMFKKYQADFVAAWS